MIGRIAPTILATFLLLAATESAKADKVHRHGIAICSVIVLELTEGKITADTAGEICLAIAQAGNRHFGRVTCGDMWLYMAIAYVESGFRNNIVNHQNCWGMFQVHAPSWAGKFGLKYKDLRDPGVNADVGIQVYKYYLERYKKIIPALSAYNSDDPRAAVGYALAVLSTRKKIKQRYTQLYKSVMEREMASLNISAW